MTPEWSALAGKESRSDVAEPELIVFTFLYPSADGITHFQGYRLENRPKGVLPKDESTA